MVVSGTNSGTFCKNFGSVILSEVTGAVTVDYHLDYWGGEDDFQESYSPDADGIIRINYLGEVALAYFQELGFDMPESYSERLSVNYVVTLTATVLDAEGAELGSFSQKFYYSNCRTSLEEPHKYKGFLNRHHRRKILPAQMVPVAYFDQGQLLGIGVSYLKDGTEQWVEFQVPTVDGGGWLNCRNVGLEMVVAQLKEYASLEVSADDVFYYIVFLKDDTGNLDAIQFDVDRTHYPSVSHFVYYNCFGVPDTLFFTGKDTRTAEMEATYATIRRNYRKINTTLNIFHDVNTGYINRTLRECVEDLVNSTEVRLYDENGLGDAVTITEISFEESRPRTEPINVKLKYRLSTECQWSVDRDMTIDYKIFDHTFGDTFE